MEIRKILILLISLLIVCMGEILVYGLCFFEIISDYTINNICFLLIFILFSIIIVLLVVLFIKIKNNKSIFTIPFFFSIITILVLFFIALSQFNNFDKEYIFSAQIYRINKPYIYAKYKNSYKNNDLIKLKCTQSVLNSLKEGDTIHNIYYWTYKNNNAYLILSLNSSMINKK